MGEVFLSFYRTKIKREYKLAFFSTFLITLLIHLYKFTNTLPNHDSVYNYYSDQNVLGSGRWALSLACGISSYFDLPWVIGLFCCVFIGLTAVIIVSLLRMKNPVLIVLSGALLAASPSTTETFFFLFTADGYMIAMFLSALGVYFSRIEEARLSRFTLAGVCICISCGIYQAYVSFALILAVCYFVDILLEDRFDKKQCLNWVFRQAVLYTLSLAAYYMIWKLLMYLSGTTANNYQGISEVGKISISLLGHGLFNSIKSTALYFLQWNVLEHGFTLYSVINILFLLLMGVGLIISFVRSKIIQRKWALGLLTLCLIAIIPFACIWHFVSESVGYRAMMLQSLVLLYILTAQLYEKWANPVMKNVVCVFLILIIGNHALMANISYFFMDRCYERTYAEGAEMMAEIHDLQDEYEIGKIAIVGTRIFEVQYNAIDTAPGTMLHAMGEIHILGGLLETSLLFDSDHTILYMQNTFGLELEPLPRSQRIELFNTDQVQAMGCWPSGDSITVIGDTLVIKLSNQPED